MLIALPILGDAANDLFGIGAAGEGSLGECPIVFGLAARPGFAGGGSGQVSADRRIGGIELFDLEPEVS